MCEPRYTLQEAAHAIGIGERALFADLRRRRILDQRNVPTWRFKARGLDWLCETLIQQAETHNEQ